VREAQVVASRRAVYLLLVCALSPDGRLSGVRSAADLRRHAILPPTPPNEACFGSRSIACPRLLRVLCGAAWPLLSALVVARRALHLSRYTRTLPAAHATDCQQAAWRGRGRVGAGAYRGRT